MRDNQANNSNINSKSNIADVNNNKPNRDIKKSTRTRTTTETIRKSVTAVQFSDNYDCWMTQSFLNLI